MPEDGANGSGTSRTYVNPLIPEYLADPCVVRFEGRYYAYGTVARAGVTVTAWTSDDLVDWEPLGEVLEPLPDSAEMHYWAPEPAYEDGTYYLYYSAGGAEGEGHRLRVATSDSPRGPFRDVGVLLVPDQDFTIDAHPFRDAAGRWYLFYCRDFLDGDRPGTGIVVDRLVDMTTLAGDPRVVVRPYAEWNLFEARRAWRGMVADWYTVEGPFARERDGRFYCFFSGGGWKEANYGLAWATADDPLGPWRVGTSGEGPDLLRTVPGRIVGPGHASVTAAPDLRREVLVYHAWDAGHAARTMRMEPLDWRDGRPVCEGPTLEPRPRPPEPVFRALFEAPDGAPLDAVGVEPDGGRWELRGHAAAQVDDAAVAVAELPVEPLPSLLLELHLRRLGGDGRYGVRFVDERGETVAEALIDPERRGLRWSAPGSGDGVDRVLSLDRLGPRLRFDAGHRLLLERRDGRVALSVDGVELARDLESPEPGRIRLVTERAAAAFAGITVAT